MPIKIVDYKVDETGRLLALSQNFIGQLFDILQSGTSSDVPTCGYGLS